MLTKRKLKYCLVSAVIALSSTAMGLPLLSEAEGKVQDGIVTIYKDHKEPNKYYFFPNSTRFSRDNKQVPLFNFVYWGLSDANSTEKGGYLAMTTRLDSDELQKDAIRNFMKENPKAKLAVIPVISSTIGLSTTKAGLSPLTRLFEEFNFAKHGGRAEDEIGINAVLTHVGAKAFRSMLVDQAGGGLINFEYCYKFQGLGPNMDAQVSVNMKRVYEYFELNSKGGYAWFSYSIQTVIEKLHAEGAVSIKMNGGSATEWEYLKLVAQDITKRLFVPELDTKGSVGEASKFHPFRFNGGYVRKEEQKQEVWTWTRQDLEEREFCTAVNIKDLEPYKKQLISDADQYLNQSTTNY